MKIAHYMPGSTIPGGMSSYLTRLVEAQRQAGHEVSIIDNSAAISHLRVDVLHLHELLWPPPTCPIPMVRTVHGHSPYCPSGSRYLGRQRCACDRRYTLLGCTWGHFVDRCGSIRPAQFVEDFRRTRRELRQPSTIQTICISDFQRQQMIRNSYDPNRLRTIYLPAPQLAEVSDIPNEPIPRFVFLGRLVPQKGIEVLIRAIARVKQPIALDIAGDGPEQPRMETLARELGITEDVTFHGWLPPQRVVELIQSSRAVVFPSTWHEPAGLVTLEAAAAGRPVIASRVGGIPEYAQLAQNAVLVAPGDVEALAGAITQWANDAQLCRELGEKGRERARTTLNHESHRRNLDEIYERAVARV